MPCQSTSPHGSLALCQITRQAILWARQAGQIALPHFRNVTATRKADDTFQTQVDLDIEQFLVAQIRVAYPDHAILAEENTPSLPDNQLPITNNQSPTPQSPNLPSPHPQSSHFQSSNLPAPSPYLWVIDPLDGTTAFMRGLPGWGIAISLLYQGQPVMGIFYMPLLDDLTYSCAGYPFGFCKGHPVTPLAPSPTGPAHCPQPRVLGEAVQPDWAQNGFLAVTAGAHKEFHIDIDRTRALGSVGASLIYTARGSATAAFIPKAYLWDLAAGGLIVEQAGGSLRYLSGRPVDYAVLSDGQLIPEPIVAGHPKILDDLQIEIRSSNR